MLRALAQPHFSTGLEPARGREPLEGQCHPHLAIAEPLARAGTTPKAPWGRLEGAVTGFLRRVSTPS